MVRYYLFFLTAFLFISISDADPLPVNQPGNQPMRPVITLQLNDANLPDAIRLLAQFLDLNVVMSPSVRGTATLSLKAAGANQAFSSLLLAHGLAKWPMGRVWYIAPQSELIKRQEETLKWQGLAEEAAPLCLHIWTLRYAKATDLAHLLQNEQGSFLSKRGQLTIDTRTNTLCVHDTLSRILTMGKMIQALDVPVKQIRIAARLVSIESAYESALGVQFTGTNAVAGHYSLALATLADGSVLDIKLAALENSGHAQLISRPSLFTANQQSASIESGEEVPYQEVSDSGGTAIAFKKAVLSLKVTPQLLPSNQVLLQLQVNQDRPSTTTVLGMPTINTRQMMTNVLMKDGQTIVLGGIYETDQEHNEERVPFLSAIPLLGHLFKQHTAQVSKRELLIFVTPYVMT